MVVLFRTTAISLLLIALAAPLGAQEAREATGEKFAVHLGDETVVFVREGIRSLTAQERAEAITQRLKRLVDNPNMPVVKVVVEETPVSSDLRVGDTILVSVFDADAEGLGRSRPEVAAVAAQRIEEAVARYRAERTPQALLTALGQTVATLAIAALLLFVFERLYRRLQRFVLAGWDAQLAKVEQRTGSTFRGAQLRWPLLAFTRLAHVAVWVGAIYAVLSLSLSYFAETRGIARQLADLILVPLSGLAREVLEALPGLAVVLVIAVAARYILRSARFFFARVADGRVHIDGFYPEWARPTQRLVTVFVLIAAVIMAYPYIPGSGSPAFQGMAIFLGLLGSLGATGVVANLINGMLITYMRSFRTGDLVKIGDTIGVVAESSLLATRLRTMKNIEISVPNSLVLSGQVINYSISGRPTLSTSVTIGYDTPWRQVHAMLLAAAARTPLVGNDPSPFVLQTALDDFYVRYELNFTLADLAQMPLALSQLHQSIQDAFNEYGVQIMSPHFIANPEAPAIVPPAKWYAPPAMKPQREAPPPGKGG
ncbi:MAG: mechanosensitive ion channel family protein [Burkholderiales bacterium]|nr:mechanosensitive ion channel family protein [Burkholderiales bacterium]